MQADSIMPRRQDVEKGAVFHSPAPCAWARTFQRSSCLHRCGRGCV